MIKKVTETIKLTSKKTEETEVPITTMKRVVNVKETSKEIELREGEYILIESKKAPRGDVKSARFGIFGGIETYSGSYKHGRWLKLHDKGYRLGVLEVYGVTVPNVTRDPEGAVSERGIENIHVGLESIREALQSWEGLEGHVDLIERLIILNKPNKLIGEILKNQAL